VLTGLGTHNLSAQYVGDTNNGASTSAVDSVTVAAIPTTTTLSLASSSISIGASEILTATVTSTAGTPTGSVNFMSGSTSLGSAALNNGTAMFTTSSNAVGSATISAVYNGAGNFGGSTSTAMTLNFTNPLILSLSASTVSIAPGGSGTVTVSAAPAIGFTGAVTFSCSSPVAYVTCSPNPSSQTITGTAAAQSAITLNVASTVSETRRENRGLIAYALLFPLGTFVLATATRRRKAVRSLSLMCLLLAIAAAGITGCGGGSPATTTKPIAPSGSQVVTITAKSAAATQTTQVTVNIGS
jgi:hypothetical protein